ncbi:MAG: T9SS type A sorting domain-containing protein [Bacteroidetes bacterium]|nr:T9SS type A sorting domain-containing protein [Bacteroidota bacterium]
MQWGKQYSPAILAQYKNQTTINISKLSSGVYFIKVNDNENTVTLKFVKQ